MRNTRGSFGPVAAALVGALLAGAALQGGATAQDARGRGAGGPTLAGGPLGNALSADKREAAAKVLQQDVQAFIDLQLKAKQLHWNVVGPLFRPLHEQFDAIADEARESADLVAERMLALGAPTDGRPSAVAQASPLPDVPTGTIPDAQAIDHAVRLLKTTSQRLYEHIDQLAQVDPVSQNLLQDLTHEVDKQLWMLEAQQVRGGVK